MRFKIDENLPGEIVLSLREAGHEADTASDEGLAGAADADIVAHCLEEGRALVTLDLDFGNIRSYPPEAYPGIVVLRLSRQDKPFVLGVWNRANKLLAREELEGKLWVVEDTRIRIRE